MMKKIILLLFALFLSFSAFSQFPNPGVEGFENTTGPDTPGSGTSTWTLGTGVPGNQWAVFGNGVGTGRWTINNTVTTPPTVCQGTNIAYANRVNAGAGNTSQNFLATPRVTVPANGQLRFLARTFTLGNQGTFFDVRATAANPTAADQTNPAAYTTTLATYTEDQLTQTPEGVQNAFNICTLKVINFPANMIGTQVYISFVRRNTQVGTAVDGDRWLLDAVQLNERCLDPTNLGTTFIGDTNAQLTWGNPSGATSWEIEIVPAADVFTGVGTITYSGPLPYNATSTTGATPAAFTPLTFYKYRVRAICSGTGINAIISDWSTPAFNFNTTVAPPVCGGNFVDPGGVSANYPNNITATAGGTTTICPNTPGELVTVTFTSFSTQAGQDILTIYDGGSVATGTVLGNFSGNTLPPAFTSSNANGCLTFVFVSNGNINAPGWIANVSCAPPPPCQRPTAVVLTNQVSPPGPSATPNSLNVGFTPVGVGTAWEYVILPSPSPAPTAATVGTAVPSNPFLITQLSPGVPLTSNTCYDIYIRSVCSGIGVSEWSAVLNACTTIAPPICGGNYVDTGGTTAAYGPNEDNTITICPVFAGEEVTVTFTSFNTQATFDGMYVYASNTAGTNQLLSANGPGNAAGPLTAPGAFWGAVIPGPFTGIAANGGCLTFVFKSDATVNNPGWLANVTCAPPPTCPKPINFAVVGTPTFNSVALNWTNVGPATSWQVIALPCTSPPPTPLSTGWVPVTTAPSVGNPFILNTGINPSTCYNIWVRGNCGPNDLSLWTGPVTITTPNAPPVCGGQFYDPAGPNANYGNNLNSTVTICPSTPGEIVTVTFTSFNTEATWDGLYVYDGSVVTPGALIPSTNGPGNGGLTQAGAYWGANIPGPFSSTAADGCLTFVFITDGTLNNPGWVSNITCSPAPTCAKPTNIIANPVTQTSATITWTQPLNPDGSLAGAWEVLVLPAGSPVPTTPGIPVTTTSYVANNLTPGTAYVFYVRAICSPTDSSIWAPLPFATRPVNDECANATFAIVNQNLNCVQTTPGTLAGATGSLPASTCGASSNDDVWFTFTATAATHVISFNNVSLPAPVFNYAIYQGTCTGLTQVACNSGAGLTAGTTYFLRVYSVSTNPSFSTFNLCIGTLPCTEAPAFCTGQTVTYNNSTNVPSLGTIGCLFTSPNPAFFFLQVNQAGPLSYLISQVDTNGQPRDVDYVAWGPFTDLNTACSGVPANPLPGIIPALTPAQGCGPTIHACSYSAAPTEIMCIPNAQLCQVYVIMITNFSNAAGTVTFTQTNTGGGTTQCFPINTFNYPQTYYCQNSTDPTPVLSPGATAGTYTATPAGLAINPVTGQIDLSASLPGPYIVTSTTLTSTGGACTNIPTITTTRTVIITAPADATISYANTPFCKAITSPQPVTLTGTTGGTYSSSPAGLFVDATTGAILPVSSNPGLYTVTYTVPAVGGCAAFTTTAQVEILPSVTPLFTQVQPICPGDALAPLPTTSNNGVVGTWSPAINNLATTTYTFTPTPGPGICASSVIMTIAVGSTTPTFTQVGQICAGAPLAALPTTSNNGVIGTWSPAINNLATTTYTFTPAAGVCATPVTMTILVNPAIDVTVNSSTICQGGTATVTATPALAGNYTYTWTVPAGFPNPGNVASFTTTVAGNYTVVLSQNNAFCNNDFENPVGTLGSLAFVPQSNFPCWGTTATDGMIEVWTNGTESTFAYSGTQFIELNANQVSTLFQNITVIPGSSVAISFAHRGRFSGTDVMAVEVGPVGGPYVSLGNFSATPSAWVYNTVPYTFPNNGVTNYTLRFVSVSSGSGSLTVGNFIDAVSIAGIGCPSVPTTGTVNVTTFAVPTFTQVPNICQDTPAPTLPTTSNDTVPITGTWSPATINTSTLGTTTYTFTPNSGQCADVATMNITIVAPSIVPTFNQVGPFCEGVPAGTTLPASSTNGTPITGTWSPSTIDTTTAGTTTYTFTPASGQCAVATTMVINVAPPSIVPTFNQVGPFCEGVPAGTTLPTSSTNATPITGTWSPSTIDTTTAGSTTYTFTPAGGQCAVSTTMVITVNPPSIVPTFSAIASICQNATAPSLPGTSTNSPAISGTWSPATIDTSVVGSANYTFTPAIGQCAVPTTISITINPQETATFTQIGDICQGGVAPALPTASTNSTPITGTWSPAAINTSVVGATVYTFTPNANQCALGTTMTVNIIANPVLAQVNPVFACESYTLPPLSVGNYYASPNGQNPITNLTLTTTQTVYVFAQSNTVPPCTDSDSFLVTINQDPEFDITGGCQGSVYVLQVINANFDVNTASYSWSGPNGAIVNNSPTLTATASGVYTVTVSVPNGPNGSCINPESFDTLGANCEIPKGISPNGDGLNDSLDLSGFNVGKLTIFNRYGKTVYSKVDYKDEWFGQSDSGNELPDGTYYYVVEGKAGGDAITGWVYINRENR